MDYFGLDFNPYAMERCLKPHPTLDGVRCQRKSGHDTNVHTDATESLDGTITWEAP
jgi:hypothetical protein